MTTQLVAPRYRPQPQSFGVPLLNVFLHEQQSQLRTLSERWPYAMYRRAVDIGTVGGGEDDLASVTLALNELWRDDMGPRIHAAGTLAANANSKTVKLYVGATSYTLVSTANADAQAWVLDAHVVRLSATSARVFAVGQTLFGTPGTTEHRFGSTDPSPAWDTTGVVIKCTGTGTADNDIVQKLFWLEVWG